MACWNPWGMCNERLNYCRSMNFDVLGLTELHNAQNKKIWKGRHWITSEDAAVAVCNSAQGENNIKSTLHTNINTHNKTNKLSYQLSSPSYYLTAWLLLLNYGGPLSGPGLLAGPISGFKGQSGALSVSSIAFCWALHRVRRSWGRYSSRGL